MIGGRIEMMHISLNPTIVHIRAGTLRPLVVTVKDRWTEYLPDVPTTAGISVAPPMRAPPPPPARARRTTVAPAAMSATPMITALRLERFLWVGILVRRGSAADGAAGR